MVNRVQKVHLWSCVYVKFNLIKQPVIVVIRQPSVIRICPAPKFQYARRPSSHRISQHNQVVHAVTERCWIVAGVPLPGVNVELSTRKCSS